MKVCIPCNSPGGPEAAISSPFEEADLLDYYEVRPDGMFEHVSQARNCGTAGCVDPVDAIVCRRVEAVVVIDISAPSLMRLKNAGVRVLVAENPSVRVILESVARGVMKELTSKDIYEASLTKGGQGVSQGVSADRRSHGL